MNDWMDNAIVFCLLIIAASSAVVAYSAGEFLYLYKNNGAAVRVFSADGQAQIPLVVPTPVPSQTVVPAPTGKHQHA